jgi:hypothetical protein
MNIQIFAKKFFEIFRVAPCVSLFFAPLSTFARFLYMRQYTTIKPNNLNYQTL